MPSRAPKGPSGASAEVPGWHRGGGGCYVERQGRSTVKTVHSGLPRARANRVRVSRRGSIKRGTAAAARLQEPSRSRQTHKLTCFTASSGSECFHSPERDECTKEATIGLFSEKRILRRKKIPKKASSTRAQSPGSQQRRRGRRVR